MVATCILAVLVAAACLRPAEKGIGTHTQMGMSQCSWIVMMNRPCPTCGMTTAFAAAANLQPMRAVVAQPFAAIGAVLAGGVFWGAVHMAVFGSRLGHVFARITLRPRVLWPLGAAWAASWVYKVLTMPPGA